MIARELDTEKNSNAIDTENNYSDSIMAVLIEAAPKNAGEW